MDKGVSGGADSIKQWDGAYLVHRLIFMRNLGDSSTGCMPTRPSREDAYQLLSRHVANSHCKRVNRQVNQSKRKSCQ